MMRLPPRDTRTDTLFPYTTLFRSGGRAIVGDEIDLPECLPRPFAERVEQVARGREGAGIGALESEDRLLAVADGEQRADALGIARRHHEKQIGRAHV